MGIKAKCGSVNPQKLEIVICRHLSTEGNKLSVLVESKKNEVIKKETLCFEIYLIR